VCLLPYQPHRYAETTAALPGLPGFVACIRLWLFLASTIVLNQKYVLQLRGGSGSEPKPVAEAAAGVVTSVTSLVAATASVPFMALSLQSLSAPVQCSVGTPAQLSQPARPVELTPAALLWGGGVSYM
jgi:hypothetical protein